MIIYQFLKYWFHRRSVVGADVQLEADHHGPHDHLRGAKGAWGGDRRCHMCKDSRAGCVLYMEHPAVVQKSPKASKPTKPSFEKLMVEYGKDMNLNASQDGVLLPIDQPNISHKNQETQTKVTALNRVNGEDAILPLPWLYAHEKKKKHGDVAGVEVLLLFVFSTYFSCFFDPSCRLSGLRRSRQPWKKILARDVNEVPAHDDETAMVDCQVGAKNFS